MDSSPLLAGNLAGEQQDELASRKASPLEYVDSAGLAVRAESCRAFRRLGRALTAVLAVLRVQSSERAAAASWLAVGAESATAARSLSTPRGKEGFTSGASAADTAGMDSKHDKPSFLQLTDELVRAGQVAGISGRELHELRLVVAELRRWFCRQAIKRRNSRAR